MDNPFTSIAGRVAAAREYFPGIINGDDPEALHQYRVNLRRARSLLRWFGQALPESQREQLKTTLKAAFSPTGPLRDLDVLLLGLEEQADQLPSELAGDPLEAFRSRLRQQRTDEAMVISRQIDPACQQLPDTLPAGDATAVLTTLKGRWKRHRKKIKKQIKRLPEGDPAEIHQLRIAFKEVRYLLELFDSKAASKATRKLKQQQNALGDYNDCQAHAALLSQQLAQCRSPRESALVGACWQQLTTRGSELNARLRGNGKRYRKLLKQLDKVITAG